MKTTLWIVTVFSLIASPTFAQSADDRVRLSFGTGVTAGSIDGELSLTGSGGYRFTNHFSFEVEFTASDEAADRFADRVFSLTNGLDFGRSQIGNLIGSGRPDLFRALPATSVFPIPIEGTTGGSTFLTTAGFRYELPVQGTRFRPYVNGGLGFSRTEETLNIALASNATTSSAAGRGGTPGTISSASITFPEIDQSFSHIGMMGSAGVGASLRVFKGLWADLNVRYYRLDRSRHLGTFGGGVSYRF